MDSNEYFNTGWDPHQALLNCEENIRQCAIAINTGSEITKDLANKYNHQQEVIQQLIFQNRKLQQMIELLKEQVVRQDTQINLIQVNQRQ